MEFFLQRDKIFQVAYGIAEEGRKSLRHLRDILCPGNERIAADAFQGVVKKMGVDLVLQGQILGLPLAGADEFLCGEDVPDSADGRLCARAEGIAHVQRILHGIPGGEKGEQFFGLPVWFINIGVDGNALHRQHSQGQQYGQIARLHPIKSHHGRHGQKRRKKDGQQKDPGAYIAFYLEPHGIKNTACGIQWVSRWQAF
ncbi:hypothetical protein SDC9_194230 [bioreactor metagenome]|uniref:Uncharacterized protein n=1 Tax=bioreactor metagenome TaxID=1076179 RepID=A0A645I8B7_9ZZZZ